MLHCKFGACEIVTALNKTNNTSMIDGMILSANPCQVPSSDILFCHMSDKPDFVLVACKFLDKCWCNIIFSAKRLIYFNEM